MKKLLVAAIALGALAVSCAPPTTINIQPSGGDGGDDTGSGAGGGNPTTTPIETTGGGGDDEPTAHDIYVDEVHPSLVGSCVACHNPDNEVGAPAFMDYDAELSYQIIRSYPNVLVEPENSILITQPPHTGPALSASQKELVSKWLQMELDEADGGGGSGGEGGGTTTTGSGNTLQGMLEEFAGCMDYDLWEASGMSQFPLQQTNGEGPCMSCHNTGAGALWLSGDPLETFEKMSIFPYVMRLVTPVYEGSDVVDLAPSNRLINKGKEPCPNEDICHPKFELTPQNKQALESFVGTTLTKWQSGACDKP